VIDIFKSEMSRKHKDNPDEVAVNPIKFQIGVSILIIKAQMNAGKTTAVIKYINEHNPKRILFVTARIQQMISTHSVLGCAATTEEEEDLYAKQLAVRIQSAICGAPVVRYDDPRYKKNLHLQDRMIDQFESLHRLSGAEPFDLVVVDEVRSVLQQSVSKNTNKTMLRANNEIFRWLVTSAAKVIALDAHIEVDRMVLDYFQDVAGYGKWQLLRYNHNSLKRNYVFVKNDIDILLDSIYADIDAKKRIMMVFRSKKQMLAVLKLIEDARKNARILSFSSNSTNKEMRVFEHINEATLDCDVLAFTSRVTVAADIQTEFHNIYAFCGSKGGCGPRDIAQINDWTCT
jgi:hypothetical protein